VKCNNVGNRMGMVALNTAIFINQLKPKMKTLAISILFLVALVSCRKLEDPIGAGNPELISSWIDPQYSDTTITYTRAGNLIENQYGITFESDNKLIQRQNSGWCGTPPISTADYPGTWKMNDSIVNFTVGYWGGTADFTWEIVNLNKQKLVVSVIKSEYHSGK